MFQLHLMIEKWTPDLLTLSTIFYAASVSRNLFSKAEMSQFGASGTERLTDVTYYRFAATLSVLTIVQRRCISAQSNQQLGKRFFAKKSVKIKSTSLVENAIIKQTFFVIILNKMQPNERISHFFNKCYFLLANQNNKTRRYIQTAIRTFLAIYHS